MKKRVISAAVMIAILVPILLLGGKYFAAGAGLLSVLAYKEILDIKENQKGVPNLVKALGLICMLLLVFADFDGYSIIFGITYKGLSLLVLALFIPTLFYKDGSYTTREALYLAGVVTFLGLFFNSLILIRVFSIHKIIYLLLIAILTDTFAMLTGMFIGKHKLCPTISPKKTIEGSVGGTLMGTTIASIYYVNLVGPLSISLIIVTFLLSIAGQLGDLFFSKIKREVGIKDFSNLIPGHGGILDRIDSLTFIVLAYVIFMSFI